MAENRKYWWGWIFVLLFATLTVITFKPKKPKLIQGKFNVIPSEINIQNIFNLHINRTGDSNVSSDKIDRSFRIAWYLYKNYGFFGNSKYDPTKCSVKNCLLEENTNVADIVVLQHWDISHNPPIKKGKNQIWVLHTGESPYHTYHPSPQWAKYIDLCASYMESSDFFVPQYGRLQRRNGGPTRNFTGILRKKTKDAVWVSSHCPTQAKREDLVKELSKHLQVDTFGTCGTKQCGKQYDDLKQCAGTFVNNYKFYFAFENSICDNYTTEKLYSLFRDRAAIIPVINGPRDVSKYLPKGTYINRFDYSSPKELAEELKRIGNNESEYIRFLQEKDKYMLPVDHSVETFYKFQCDLCKFLRNLYSGKIKSIPRRWPRVYDESLLCIRGN